VNWAETGSQPLTQSISLPAIRSPRGGGVEALELDQQLVDDPAGAGGDGAVAAAVQAAPAAADGVDLLDEADGPTLLAGRLAQRLEEGPDLAGGHAVPHRLEAGRRDDQERHPGVAGHGLGHVGLPVPGLPSKQQHDHGDEYDDEHHREPQHGVGPQAQAVQRVERAAGEDPPPDGQGGHPEDDGQPDQAPPPAPFAGLAHVDVGRPQHRAAAEHGAGAARSGRGHLPGARPPRPDRPLPIPWVGDEFGGVADSSRTGGLGIAAETDSYQPGKAGVPTGAA
jgi:hypothetical protein